MKYVKTVNLWDPAIASLIAQGALKLQCGQWVRCGGRRPSRIVRITDYNGIWAIHPKVADAEKKPDTQQWIQFLDISRSLRGSKRVV